MHLSPNSYYHIYNRTNGGELLFRNRENYGYFLRKYRHYLDEHLTTLSYCLMPTHFHLFVHIHNESPIPTLSKAVGTLLSSYTQDFNTIHKRHGSLFQQHTKAKLIDDHRYATTLTAYIHNNSVRSRLVERPEEWEFSSYQDYCAIRNGTLVRKDMILSSFGLVAEFRTFSENVTRVEERYWV